MQSSCASFNFCRRRFQRGVGTLIVTVVLALVTSIIGLLINRTVINETQVVSGAQRSQEALLVAEGKLDAALNVFTTQTGLTTIAALNAAIADANVKVCVPPISFVSGEQTFEGKAGQTCATPADLTVDFIFLVKGVSADGTAARYVSQVVSAVGGDKRLSMFAPLTVQGAVGNLTGNATVINNHRNLTIWTGKDISSLSGSFETQIRLDGANNQISSSKGSGSTTTLGPDVVYNDLNLKNMSSADFQKNLLGDTASNLRSRADIKIDLGATPTPNLDSLLSGDVSGKVISIFNSTGSPVSIDLKKSFGTEANPVTFIVEGDVKFTGKFDFYGVLYANKADFKGGGHIRGALYADTVEGPPGKGNFTIEANDTVTDKVSEQLIPSRKAIRQTWRDW